MSTVAVEVALLRDLLARRDELVRALTAAVASGEWDRVMAPFDGLLAAIRRLEKELQGPERPGS